ncbi:MAG: FAD-dependent thymidylate synthase, partial [Myxococcota bacterium]|nr:FAD-dependent thymidylate synthase [Myxococcota bacterium]
MSAAYARISRSRKPVDELRRMARTEVSKARRSNQRIIWEMGHHSVAEHAVFNFDLIGVSRLAIEAVEQFRLCSFTEKSQRYITLDGDFVVPGEVKDAGLEAPFVALVEAQNELYRRINEDLLERLVADHPEDADSKPGMRLLRGAAKEDARYVTALATEGQLGMTVNARNLELMVRRFAAHPLQEVRELGRELYGQVEGVAPSLVLFTDPCDRDRLSYGDLAQLSSPVAPAGDSPVPRAADGRERECGRVRRVDVTPDADLRLVAALLHTVSRSSYGEAYRQAEALDEAGRREVVTTSMRHMELYDTMLREFEYVGCTFEFSLSAACFGQLKRHRMMTLTAQPYDPALGLTIPPAVQAAGFTDEIRSLASRAEALSRLIGEASAAAAPYALLNAHRRRALVS